MLQELYDRCVATSTIRECKGQMQNPTFYTPNTIDEEQKRIINHLAEIDAEQRIQNSKIETLQEGNFPNVKVADTLKVDKIESFSTGKVTFVEPVEISDLTVTNLHIECLCADDSEKFAGQDCDQWKEIINNSCVADSDRFAGKDCDEWKSIIKTTYVDNAANSTKLGDKTYEEVCEDILAHIPPQPYSGEIDVYCGDVCLCTINCDNPLVLSENAFNENAKIDTNTYPGACCTGTLVESDIADFITMAEVDACGYTTCTGTLVESDIQDFITMNDVDQCGYTTCKGTVTSVKTCLNGCESNTVTDNGTLALDITPTLCFSSSSRKICNKLGNKTSNAITLPAGINCTGTLVASDIADFITMSDVDACGYTTCKGTVTQVKVGNDEYNPTNGVICLPDYPPDLSSCPGLNCTGNVTTSQLNAVSNRVSTIEGKIPSQASSTNQLADKEFVNSSIETNTATFRGTFNSVADLEAYTGPKDNNDYAFVVTFNSATSSYQYDRYKYNGTSWVFEYTINTTGFTAEQLAALNSGITDTLVAKITDVYNCRICIQKNNICIGSFTLNQSSNKSINITVPTKTSDITNDCNYTSCTGTVTGITLNNCAFTGAGALSATIKPSLCYTSADRKLYTKLGNQTSSAVTLPSGINCTGTLVASDIADMATCTWVNNQGYTTCVGTVTSVNVCLNGTNATAITTSGEMCLNLTPSLSYTSNTRALTTTLGNKTSTAITLPEGINCTGTLVASDLDGYATEAWVTAKNYCTHDCLVKLSLLCSNADRAILQTGSGFTSNCICPVYASNGVPFTYNACTGHLKIGDFSCNCCHQLLLRPNNGLVHYGLKGTQNNIGAVYLEGNCLDNCSIGVGIGSGNVNRGIFHYCKASEDATSATFQWLQYWDAEKEIHSCPIWGELGDNNKVVYSCVAPIPSNIRRYALICFDKACCGNPSQTSACFEVDIYNSKYNIWIDASNNVALMRTYWQTNGIDSNCNAYGSFCAALPDTTANGNCFWITYSNYRAPVIKSARKISIICNTTTAPSGITFTAPTNRNSYTDVYCGTTCVCTLQGPAELCLSPNAFNTNAQISTTTYPGACCTGTLVESDIADMATQTWVNNKNYCTHDCLVKHSKLTSSSISIDRNILIMGHNYVDGCVCPVWFSETCKLTFNPTNGQLKSGNFIYNKGGCTSRNIAYNSKDYTGGTRCTAMDICAFMKCFAACHSLIANENLTVHYSWADASNNCICWGTSNKLNLSGAVVQVCANSYSSGLFNDTTTCGIWSAFTIKISNINGVEYTFYACKAHSEGTAPVPATICCSVNSVAKAVCATNSTCFNGCTYVQACENIRTGLVTSTDLDSCGYTTCTGTISSISLNGNAFTVSNGAATLTGFKPDTAVLSDCTTTIKRNPIKVNAGYPLALLGANTAIDNANIYVSCYCQVTFNSCNGVLSSPILCATSYVRTPAINAAGASGASKVCNVVIRACCTDAKCTITCSNFTFCGSTGRMHGDVCGNLYGNATNSCLVCRYTINTGVQHVLLGANCTACASTCVRVSNGCPLTFDPATGTLCTCEVVANNFIPTPTCPAMGICYIDFNGFMRAYKIASTAKVCDVFCSLCDFFDFYTSKGVNGTIDGQYIDNIYNYNGSIAFRAINTDFLVVSNSNTSEIGCNINFIISL